MRFILIAILFFFKIAASNVQKNVPAGAQHVTLAVSNIKRQDHVLSIELEQLAAYSNKGAEVTEMQIRKKEPVIISPYFFLETIVRLIYNQARQNSASFFFRMRILNKRPEQLQRIVEENTKDIYLYKEEMKYILNQIARETIIITQFHGILALDIKSLSHIDFSGVLIVCCANEEEIKSALLFQAMLPLAFVVAIEQEKIEKYLSSLHTSDRHKMFSIEIQAPNTMKRNISRLMSIFVLIGFLTVMVSTVYLLLTRRAQPTVIPKTVRTKDLKKLPVFVYSKIPKETRDSAHDCIICFEKFIPASLCRMLPCNHFYHTSCIDVWLIKYSNRCPYCQKAIEQA
ncbi:hypothetical protein NEMIN01_0227 [Nematocida minor]|uniref:uncharacterized protein n=1 Tax=Nematocida minor TaxID=1912983 RepID=UPI00221F958F|nr:uncharacterized protein NEMIN01_0227 [Nematocida minor]KAI5188963.1 hypothetical protein NEMIN01_0227 [Nematocida minor]